MSHPAPKLALRPERCDGCGRCERACRPGALKVGRGYLFVDWAACDACAKCVDACDRDAIARATAPSRRRPAGERAASPARAAGGWTLAEAVALLAALLALFVLEELALASGALAALPGSVGLVARLLVVGAYYSLSLAAVVAVTSRRGTGLARAFRLTGEHTSAGHKALSAAVTAGMLLATLAVMLAWGRLASAIGWDQPERWSSDLPALFGADVPAFALALLIAAGVGPFVEELVFRGVLLGAIEDRWGPAAAALGSAAVFGVFHFSAWQFVPAALLGLALSWLTLRRRSLWPAIALHCAYNALLLTAAFVAARYPG